MQIDPRMVKWDDSAESSSPKIDPRMVKWDDQAPAEKPRTLGQKINQFAVDTAAAVASGAGEIGSTLMAPIDYVAKSKARPLLYANPLVAPFLAAEDRGLVPEGTFVGRDDRRESLEPALQSMGANPDSLWFKGVKLGTQIAGTSGIGGVLAKGAQAIPALARFAPALQSGGFTLGDAATKSRLANAAIRAGAGGISGATMAGLVNPEEADTGAIIGALTPPTITALGKAGGYLGRNLATLQRSLTQPFTATGQRQVAGNILRETATNADEVAKRIAKNPSVFVAGSNPTLGQVADDAGLAQLERSMVNRPELQQAYSQQRASRLKALDAVAGEPGYIDEIKAGRKLFANEDFANAYAQGFEPQALAENADRIKALLKRPSIKNSINIAKELAAESGQKIDDFGSVKGMDYLRKALDDQISVAKNMGSSVGKERLNALINTKQELMSVLTETSPAYREAVQNYADMSRNINAAEVAQYVKNKFQPALADYGATNRELSDAYARALKEAEGSIKKATGMDLPLSRVMPKNEYEALQGVARDLARKSNLETAGRAVGSNTAQNLLSQNLTSNMVKSLGLPKSVSQSGLLNVLTSPYQMIGNVSGATQRIDDLIAQAVADPFLARSLMDEAQRASRIGLLSVPQNSRAAGLLRMAPATAPTIGSD